MIERLGTAKITQLALVLTSLLLCLWHFGPLHGTVAALVLLFLSNIWLGGYLTARALGMLNSADPLAVRLIWIATCGLGVLIVSGAVARLALVPPPLYVIALHVFMGVLIFVPAQVTPAQPITRTTLPAYVLLVGVCLLFIGVGWERNHLRFDGYEDQTLLVSLTDWWANKVPPENLVSRNIGEVHALTYWSTDGLTYVLATWVWSGGFSAVQLIWYALTPLFVGLVPLAHFALALQVTKREDTAAAALGITLILALTTSNSISGGSGYLALGQEAAFQLNTLRTFANALMLPLALTAFFALLRTQERRYLLATALIVLALALVHPRQFLAVLILFYALIGVWWLANPSWARLRQALLLGGVLLPSVLVPLWQYSNILLSLVNPVSEPIAAAVVESATVAAATVTATVPEGAAMLTAFGRTFGLILDPRQVINHPFTLLCFVLAPLALWHVRRSLAAQITLATTITVVALAFVPPLFGLFVRFLSAYFGIRLVIQLFFVVPYGLLLGIVVSELWARLTDRMRLPVLASRWAITGGVALGAFVLLVEPIPVPQSGRDQITAATEHQLPRDIRPFDENLLARLSMFPVPADKPVYLTSNRLANYIIESVPNAFVTGGRDLANTTYVGSTRFFEDQAAPWLDSADIEFLDEVGVDIIVVARDNTRAPPLLLQPERFELLASSDGTLIFALLPGGYTPASLDSAFAAMNARFATAEARRWEGNTFYLSRGGDRAHWQGMITRWERLYAAEPENPLVQYGLAFATLMAGEDRLDLWEGLSAAHPDIFLFTDAYAHVLREQGQAPEAVSVLLNTFSVSAPEVQVLAARSLLTPTFFYALTPDQITRILTLEQSAPVTWNQIMIWDQLDNLRMRAALLMSAGHWDVADRWLSQIQPIEISPADLVARAAIHLAQGDTDAALALLQPATDADWVKLRGNQHPDRWTPAANAAAQFYARLMTASDEALSPRRLAQTGDFFVLEAQVEPSGNRLSVSAVIGNFVPALPPQSVTIEVISPDAATVYAEVMLPILIPSGTLQTIETAIDLPPDLPPLTEARVIIKPEYSPAVSYPARIVETLLMRPWATAFPPDTEPLHVRFGDHITLVGYTADSADGLLKVTLYWRTDDPLLEDFQVTVQGFAEDGTRRAQQDNAPVGGRYPTRFWVPNTIIADDYTLPLGDEAMTIRVGMYRLADFTRLPIMPNEAFAEAQVQDDLLRLATITVGE